MNRNQMTMAVTGAVALLATLGIGYFIMSEGSAREEAIGELDVQKNVFSQNRNASRDEEKAVRANVAALREWTDSATELASSTSGAAKIDTDTSASVFKSRMLDDVRRYQGLPKEAKTKFVAEGDTPIDQIFPDFKDYIIRNSMPEAPVLRRRWAEICMVADALIECGAESLVSVKVDTPPPQPVDPKAKRQGAKQEGPSFKIDEERYTFVFMARQDALVRTLNALAKLESFISVDAFSFAQDPDPLVAVLGGSGKDKEKNSRRGSRGRHRADTSAEASGDDADAEKLRSGTVTNPADPLSFTPFKVTMSLSTLAVGPKTGKEVAE